MTLIGKNKTYRGSTRMIADQERQKSETQDDAEEHGKAKSGGFPVSAMFGNFGDSGNCPDSAACIK